ncbi:MAG: NADPH-dependent FMN reductase [Ginsengibacter sp.]
MAELIVFMEYKKVLAISGSTRQQSTNDSLIKAIEDLCVNVFDITVYKGIAGLPQFNPDDDIEDVDTKVAEFREQLYAADGILICTPEYAHGVPGTLKNAIDWTISSSNFPHKPTMLITASTDGKYGHAALLETLKVIEAKNVMNLQMVIPFVKTKISLDGKITDSKTLAGLETIIAEFIKTLNDHSHPFKNNS